LLCLTTAVVGRTEETLEPVSRPRIGLALGGGGALGLSHVGVIQALEEMRIPVDCLVGTSMGAIIGGMYASGMSPEEMQRAMVELNWWSVMKDRTSRRDMMYRRKRDDQRYMMDIEIGWKGTRLMFPHGLAAGQKFNNVIQSLTVNAAGITDFDRLNIPFRATGTDLQSGGLVVLSKGNLGNAMRASMAVPGAFTPVIIDGKTLVDGGLVANLPVDVARGMGADFVIAVDVGLHKWKSENNKVFDSAPAILSRTYDIMRRPDQDRAGRSADIWLAPDVTAFSASEFHRAREIIAQGRVAVAGVSNQLARYSLPEKEWREYLARQRRNNSRPLVVKEIELDGNRRVSDPQVLCWVETGTNRSVSLAEIERDASRIYGIGEFESVTYELLPRDDGYNLRLYAKEKDWGPGYLRTGLRLEADGDNNAIWSLLFNLTRRQLNGLGGELNLDFFIGTDRGAAVEWFQPLLPDITLFAAPIVQAQSALLGFYEEGIRVAEYVREDVGGGLDLGSQFFNWGEFRAGLYYGDTRLDRETGDADLPSVEDQVAAWTSRLVIDRFDDAVFPTLGYLFDVRGFFADENVGSDLSYSRVAAKGSAVKTLSGHTVVLGGAAGTSLGTEVPIYDQFMLGGFATIPGVAIGELRGPYFGHGFLTYRYQISQLSPSLGDGLYAIVKGAMGNVWEEEDDWGSGDWVSGVAVGLGADTLFGPVVVGVGLAESRSLTYYLSLGSMF
jgi:NTE family protein